MRVLYGISLDFENRVIFDDTTNYETSFKVLDAYDYSSISTIDVKRNIYDLSVSSDGSLIALVENQPAYDSEQETFVKIYAVGVKKSELQDEVRSNNAYDYDDDDDGIQYQNQAISSSVRRSGRNVAIMLGESHARQRRQQQQQRRLNDFGNIVFDNDVANVNNAPVARRRAPALMANWGFGNGGGDGGVAAGNNNNNDDGDNDVVAQRMRDLDVLRGGDNALLRQAQIQTRQQQLQQRRRHRNQHRRRNSRGEIDIGANIIWLDGGGGPAAAAAVLASNVNVAAGVAAPAAGISGAGRFRSRQRARNGNNAPIAAVVEPAAAAAALAAVALQRNPRGRVNNHVLSAARSAYQRLAQRHINMNRADHQLSLTLHRGTLTRRRRINRAIIVRRPAAAAAPVYRLYRRPPAAMPLSPADEAQAAVARLRRNDLDFEIFDELDQLANNIISLLAGR